MNRIAPLLALAALTVTAVAQADVTYAPVIFGAANNSGTPIVNGTYVMVLDRNNDGWLGHSYTAQAPAGAGNSAGWLWDPNDLLLQKGIVGDSSDPNAWPGDLTDAFITVPTSTPGYSPTTNHVYLLWFAASGAGAGPGVGAQYGARDIGVAVNDGDVISPVWDSSVGDNVNATLLTVDAGGMSWHNPTLAGDVNDDGVVAEADALRIIARLNAVGSHLLAEPGDTAPLAGAGDYWDVDNDGYIAPLDALRIINQLNEFHIFGGPELLSGSVAPVAVPEPATLLLLGAAGGLLALRRRVCRVR